MCIPINVARCRTHGNSDFGGKALHVRRDESSEPLLRCCRLLAARCTCAVLLRECAISRPDRRPWTPRAPFYPVLLPPCCAKLRAGVLLPGRKRVAARHTGVRERRLKNGLYFLTISPILPLLYVREH
jgi:hypothetical protein